jgi:hypothetical protein
VRVERPALRLHACCCRVRVCRWACACPHLPGGWLAAGMEAVVANLLEPGDKIVVGVNGIWVSLVVLMRVGLALARVCSQLDLCPQQCARCRCRCCYRASACPTWQSATKVNARVRHHGLHTCALVQADDTGAQRDDSP